MEPSPAGAADRRAFALPLVWFLARGQIKGGLRWRLAGIFALGGLQGFVGWWMVSSGLVHRIEVAQERLAIHLLLASATFAAMLWTAVGLQPNFRDPLGPDGASFRREAGALLALALAQIGLGGLVAGLRAGLVYNTWPLMDGRFIPPADHLFSLTPWTANFLDNVTMVQFQHRMIAYLLLALALFHALHISRETIARRAVRRAVLLAAFVRFRPGWASRRSSSPFRFPPPLRTRLSPWSCWAWRHPSPQARLIQLSCCD